MIIREVILMSKDFKIYIQGVGSERGVEGRGEGEDEMI